MDIQLDSNWDLDLTTDPSDLTLTSENKSIEQHITQRVWTFQGEWFLDLNLGVAWYQAILKKAFNPIEVDAELITAIAETPGVDFIQTFQTTYDGATRELDVSFEAQIDSELVDFSLQFPVEIAG